MNKQTAFSFLGISDFSTFEELQNSYRELLKKYHPDQNKDRTEWSHRMTIRLTEAYKAAIEIFRTKFENPKGSLASQDITEQDTATNCEQDNEQDNFSLGTQLRVSTLYNEMQYAVENYYLHGMEKLYLREEGSFRLHYKLTLHRIVQTIIDLEDLLRWPASVLQIAQIQTILNFTQAFYKNMQIISDSVDVQTPMRSKTSRYYFEGSRVLDQALQRVFCKTLNESNYLHLSIELYVAEQNFFLLIKKHPKNNYLRNVVIKLQLIKSFRDLCKLVEEEVLIAAS